jgi:4-amino-4-deoxy-L-arabinose transferase-like glycosyltransferase
MLVIWLGAVFLRVRLLSLPLERDEGEYAYIGWLMLQGVPPYSEAYTMKWPGIHAAYAGAIALFGHSPEGIRTGLVVVNLAAISLIYLLGRELFGRLGSVSAAATYAILSLGHTVHGFIANAEHFVLVPALTGIWLLLRNDDGPRRTTILGAGLCLGLAVLIKQQAMVLVAFGMAWVTWLWLMNKSPSPRRFVASVVVYCSGPLILFGATCLLMVMSGTFENFWRWTIEYPRAYVSRVSWSEGGEHFLLNAVPIAIFAWPALLLALLGMYASLRGMERLTRGAFLGLFGLFSFLAVCPGLYFREHYFLFLLPSVALAAGSAIDGSARNILMRARLVAPLALASGCLAWSLYSDRDILFHRPLDEISRIMYGTSPFAESPAIADYIQQTTPAAARVAILGSEPQILFYARRRSATGFLYMYPMTERHPLAEPMQRQMIAEIEDVNPDLVVLVTEPNSWLYHSRAPRLLFHWMNDELPQRYVLEGLVTLTEDGPTRFLEGDEAAAFAPHAPAAVKLLRRRQQ